MSNDTSRSPIPIDEETYKYMHKDLPRRMDMSSHRFDDRSRSREHSMLEGSVASSNKNSDIRHFT